MARILFAIFVLIGSTSATHAQDFHAWNFDIGGGVGFPVSQSSNFANSGGNFVVGGGRNFMTGLGVNSEFMWHDLPPKRSLLDAFQAPDGSARVYAWTLNGIVRIPTGETPVPGRIRDRGRRLVSQVRGTDESCVGARNYLHASYLLVECGLCGRTCSIS